MPANRDPGAQPWIPPQRDLACMRAAVSACRGCELWRGATQAVFGAGALPKAA